MLKNKKKYFITTCILLVINTLGCTDTSINKEVKIKDYYLVKDNWILGEFPELTSKRKMKKYSDKINELVEKSNTDKDLYFVFTAHKTNMLKHLYPQGITSKNNCDYNKELLIKQLNKEYLSLIDVDKYFQENFSNQEIEKFYFKTDHHWNGLGAFEAFKFMAKSLDLELSKLELDNYFDQYQIKTLREKDLIGSYNKKLDFIVKEKEFANYSLKKNNSYEYFKSDGINEKRLSKKQVAHRDTNKKSLNYSESYLDGSLCNILNIKNKDSLLNKKVLIFRDSYQAPMNNLLADIFSEVSLVDPRYIDNIEMTYQEIIKNSDADIVIFLYNSFGFEGMIEEMIRKDESIKKSRKVSN